MDRFLHAATNPKTLFGVADPYAGTGEERRLVPPPPPPAPTPAQQRARIAPAVRQPAEATQAPAAAQGDYGEIDTQAHVEQRRDRLQRQTLAMQAAAFTPEAWRDIANRGMALGNQLFAEGKKDEAQEVLRKAYNAQLVSQDAAEADTHSAIQLSNLLGIVKDPYAGQRRNLAEAAQPGMMFTPEEQQRMAVERPAAPQRGGDITKDFVDPLVGQLPVIVAGGAIGRTVAGATGAALERAGATRAGQAIGRLAQGIEPLEKAGPSIPFTGGLRGARLGEELQAFRENAPYLLGRGATQGQVVGGVEAYRMARQQGASIDAAAAAAVESMGISIPFGAATELGLGVAGRALGVGYDPVARAIKPLADAIRGRSYGPEAVSRVEPGPDRAAMLGDLGSSLEAVRGSRVRAARQADLNDAFAAPPDEAGLYRERPFVPEPEEPTPQHPAAGAADRANTVAQREQFVADRENYERARAAEAQAHEQAAAEQAQKPADEAVADVAEQAKAGDETAKAYQDAINAYVDARVAIEDTPEGKQPSGMRQVALARAKSALNAARERYGAQTGAVAIAALAQNDDDLTDEEKQAVGLGGLVIGSTAVVPHLAPELRARVLDALTAGTADDLRTSRNAAGWISHISQMTGVPQSKVGDFLSHAFTSSHDVLSGPEVRANIENLAVSTGFVSRTRQAIEALPKAWDQPRPAADWIGKLKGTNTISKKELSLLLPDLERLQAEKTKVSRDELLRIADEKLPQLKRTTLAYEGGDESHDVDTSDLVGEDALERLNHAELREQRAQRQNRIDELEDEIRRDIEYYTDRRDSYERDMDQARERAESEAEDYGLPASVLRAAFESLDNEVESGYIPRSAVQHAMDAIADDFLPEPSDPEEAMRDHGWEVEEAPGKRYRFTFGGREFEETMRPGETEAQVRQIVETNYGLDPEAITSLTFDEGEPEYVVRDQYGHEVARDADRDEALQAAQRTDEYTEQVLDPLRDDAYSAIHDRLNTYASERAAWIEAESEAYAREEDEGNYYEQQYDDIREHQDILNQIEQLLGRPEPGEWETPAEAANAPTEPDLRPIEPGRDADPEYSGHQRIGGGTNYRELLTQYTNSPEQPYKGGHYQRYPNTLGHIRVEDHAYYDDLFDRPGKIDLDAVAGRRSQLERYNNLMDSIAKVHEDMEPIIREYDALPASEKEEARARELARQYRRKVDELDRLQEERQRIIADLRPATAKNTAIAVMIESQSDWVQAVNEWIDSYAQAHNLSTAEARNKLFAPWTPPTPEERARLEAAVNEARDRYNAADRAYDDNYEVTQDAKTAFRNLVEPWVEATRNPETWEIPGLREATGGNWTYPPDYHTGWNQFVAPDQYDYTADAWRYVFDQVPGAEEAARKAAALIKERQALSTAHVQASDAFNEAQRALDSAISPPVRQYPDSPFLDTKTTFKLNAARFLLDAAERGYDHIAWSDSANRMANASLPMDAARLVYDKITPSIMKDLLAAVGFKDVPINKIYLKGYGHWHIELTPAMRRAIRRLGLPMLGAVAAAALPGDAEAETPGGTKPSTPLWQSSMGIVAAGAALVALAKSKALRRLLQEMPGFARALNADDVTGLGAKRALAAARPVLDNDPTMSWAVFRPTENLGKLPAAQRDARLKATAKAMMDAADQLGVPMQGFRAGSADLAFALPQEKAAAFVDAVEKSATVRGQFGKTFDQAQALASEAESADRHGITLYANPIGPALRELARYPSAATLAGLGALATQSDDPNIKDAGLPIIALAALHAIGSRRIGAGKDKLGAAVVDQLSKSDAGTSVVRFFNPDALLTPEVKQAILDYEKTVKTGEARGAAMSRQAQALGPASDRAVSDVLDAEAWEDPNQFSADDLKAILATAAALGAEYADIGNQKVAAGVLPKTSLLPDYGGPRKYAFYEANEALGDEGPARTPVTRIGQQKTRTLDIPLREAEDALKDAQATGDPAKIKAAEDALDQAKVVQMSQRVERGEIREASYRAGQGIPRAYQDIAAGQLFQVLRNTDGVAHPEWVRATDDLQAAQHLKRASTNPADKDAAQALIDDAKVRLADLTRKYAQAGGDYVSLPDTPGLGQLRGAVVDRDVAHSLTGFSSKNLYQKMLKSWKEIKTIFNPGTHAANVMSNVMFLHVAGLPVWEQPLYLKRAAADLRKYGPATKAATEAGFLGVNFVGASGEGVAGRPMATEEGLTQLLGTTRPETADVLRKEGITEERAARRASRRTATMVGAGAALGAAKLWDDEDPAASLALGAGLGALGGYALAKGAKKIRATYGREDDLFRVAWMLKQLNEGKTMSQAVTAGRDVLGDFRTRSPALALLRNTVLPFALWPAKALPEFAQHIVDHPWRYLTLMAVMGGADEYAKHEVGAIDDASIPEGQRRLFGYFLPGMVQLPFKDQQGNKAAVDISRWSPGAAATTAANPSSVPAALMGGHALDIFRPQGPVVDLATRFGSNVDPFRGQQWLGPDYPLRDNAQRFANQVAGLGLPSIADYYAPTIRDDIKARDWFKLENDVQGISGLRVRYNRPASNIINAENQLRESLRTMKQEYTRALQGNHNPGRAETLNQQYVRRVRSAIDAFTRRMGTPPSDPAIHELLRQP